MRTISVCCFMALTVFVLPFDPACAEESNDLTSMSMEELMDMEIYSASKKQERFFSTPSATYVMTDEDIRRSGATNIPDLLRTVPGVHVQRIDSNSWDISIRGFNGSIFSNKVLVLMDGRSVYTPLYGGVLWDAQNVMVEDIERIEIVRGPGGAVWGANAVNGIINIITKKAKDTQGGLFTAGGGSEERGFTSARYGWTAKDWALKTYSKFHNRDAGFSSVGNDIDEWFLTQGGFRAEQGNMTFQGDYQSGYNRQKLTVVSFTPPFRNLMVERTKLQGGNLMAKYQDDELFWQVYWDATYRESVVLNERRDALDIEINRLLENLIDGHEINMGAGYRLNTETVSGTPTFNINDIGEPDQVFSLFVQDEIKFLDREQLKVILGSKFEHNIYTHFEFQPSVRVSYDLNEKNIVWVAMSRAVRTPARLETDADINGHSSGVLFTKIKGSHDLDAEEVQAYELGYRTRPLDNLFLDLAAFYNDYDELVVLTLDRAVAGPPGTGTFIFLFPNTNAAHGKSHGIELAADAKLKEWWNVKSGYTFTKLHVQPDSGVNDFNVTRNIQRGVPKHSVFVRSAFDLPNNFEFDTTLRYADAVKLGSLKPYTALDIRLAKTIKNWEVALVGQNLIDARHKESTTSFPTQVERSGYLKVSVKF